MEVTFWGVRGSIPVTGQSTVRWGGNTSCVEVNAPGLPSLIIDAGTGIRPSGERQVRREDRRAVLLLSHLHIDHLIGLPFFLPMYAPSWELRLGIPAFTEEEAKQKLQKYLNGVFHPVRLREVPAELRFLPMTAGPCAHDLWGWKVEAIRLRHPGGCLGYRISAGGRSMVYLSDTQPFATPDRGVMAGQGPSSAERQLIAFLRDADFVVYDTMYTRQEYLEHMDWGHSYPEYAIAICDAAQVKTLSLFHHHPSISDDALDQRMEAYEGQRGALQIVGAREGETRSL